MTKIKILATKAIGKRVKSDGENSIKVLVRGLLILIFFASSAVSFVALAADAPAATTSTPEPQEQPGGIEQSLISTDIIISEWLNSLASSLDLFLIGQKLTDRPNETGLRLENSTYYSQDPGLQNSPSVAVNLHLPNLEQYWNLKFTSYDEQQEKTVQQSQLRQSPRERNYGATVGLFQKLGDIRTAFEPRVELRDPVKISHSLSFASTAEMKTFTIHPKLEFYASADRGTGTFQSLNFRFRLNETFTFSEINEGDYLDRQHAYSVSNGISLGELVTNRTSISYSFFVNSNNRSSYHLDGYHLAVSWYQLLYKKILDYSITPQLNFEKETTFTGVPAISLTISLNF